MNKKNIEDIYALSSMQEGMLFHYLKNPAGEQYIGQSCLDISGGINAKALEQACNRVIETNEVLRTAFRWEKINQPVQMVLKSYAVKFHYFDLSGIKKSEKKIRLEDILTRDRQIKFDLSQVPFRVTLCKLDECRYKLILSHHHILYDGWSTGIILKELFNNYNDLVNRKKLKKLPAKTRFKEFVTWLRDQDIKEQEKFWRDYLRGYGTAAGLILRTKNTNKPAQIDSHTVGLPEGIKTKLENCINRCKVTSAALFYSAWGILLQRYNNTREEMFGTTISGRSAKVKGIENMVGLFINTLPLRVRTDSTGTVTDLLFKINEILQTREKYESTPLAEIGGYSELEGGQALFDSIMVIENYPLDSQLNKKGNGFALEIESYSAVEMVDYDLTVSITIGTAIVTCFYYNRAVFRKTDIQRFANHFLNIIKHMINDPHQKISQLEILSKEERRRILEEFNNPSANYPVNKTLPGLFEAQVERTPDHLAIVHQGQSGRGRPVMSVSYRELNGKADLLAGRLRKNRVKSGTIVGIMVERSVEMIIGILAILKAGGAYLPINPDDPGNRLNYILADCNPGTIIITKSRAEGAKKLRAGNRTGETIYLEYFDAGKEQEILTANKQHSSSPAVYGPAYVIYTSGSTGTPKGVPITHRNISALIHWGLGHLELNSLNYTQRTLQNLSCLFDWSVWEIFITLTSGACLYVNPDERLLNPEVQVEFINREKITVLHVTPTQCQYLVNAVHAAHPLETLKYLFIGAEKLTVHLLNSAIKSVAAGCRIYNMYGPTEAAIISTALEIQRGHAGRYEELSGVPIGKPVGNTRLLILDEQYRLSPLLAAGELYIAGSSLAGGYLNQPGKTINSFLKKKLVNFKERKEIKKIKGQRLYKTGDRTRWLPDGSVEFLGRIDCQVKIRGYRIEPGEIEYHLLKHERVKFAAVIDRADKNGEKYLCAYIVPHSPGLPNPGNPGNTGKTLEISRLKEYLSGRLPDYMIPVHFVMLEQIPLTPNGKLDVKALPEPQQINEDDNFVPVADETEEQLARIWSDILSVKKEKIGRNSNFFHSGGHSLKATRLIAGIQKELHINMPLALIFETPTLREMARFIKERETIKKPDQFDSIKPVPEKEYYALSSAQKRLFFLSRIHKNDTGYNIPFAVSIEGTLDKTRLEYAFRELTRRHESLRTSFLAVEQEPVQEILEAVDLKIEQYENIPDVTRTIRQFIRPFILSQVPLLRLGLVKLALNRYILVIDLPHIIADGISIGILIKEFMAIYRGEKLSPLILRYKDFSEWQNKTKNKTKEQERIRRQEEHWLNEFQGEIPVLHWPADYIRPAKQDFAGAALGFDICPGDTRSVRAYALEQGTTLYMLLLAVYYIFLSKICSQEDIVIGTPAAGRQHPGLEPIVGMFVNTLALRNSPIGEITFKQFLNKVKKKVLEASSNQDYQYEDLVEALSINRDISRNPLFDTMFALKHPDTEEIEIPGLKLKPYEFEYPTAKFDLTLQIFEIKTKLLFKIEYRTGLFKRTTIKRLGKYYKNLLSHVMENPGQQIADIEIISAKEKEQVLSGFNEAGQTARYPTGETLDQLFKKQANRVPDRIALVHKKKYFTYREINNQANRSARYLEERGVKANRFVGILVGRSLEMITGILGILKAGGVYLPINPGYPAARKKYILNDSSTTLVLTQKGFAGDIGTGYDIIYFDDIQTVNTKPGKKAQSTVKCTDFAYLIYTSGSTGNPGGAAITHSNICPLLHWGYHCLQLSEQERILQNLPFFFDWSVWEIFITLTSGASLYISSDQVLLSPQAGTDFIQENVITVLHLTPTQFQYYVNPGKKLNTLKYLFIGAETLTVSLLKSSYALIAGDCRVFNMYGPTEATIIAAVHEIDGSSRAGYGNRYSIPIGKPAANTTLLILTEYLKLCPVSVAGELYIIGDGVVRGYLNNPGKSSKSFIKNIFAGAGIPGEKMYRTGDRARWLRGGDIEFLGRIDFQIKIRGLRIEPGEIINCLLEQEKIKEAEVLVKESQPVGRGNKEADKTLCAYIVAETGLEISKLKTSLARQLPGYMVPAHFVELEQMPLTPNGKIDRKTLAGIDPVIVSAPAALRNETENILAGIWSTVLGIQTDSIGSDSDFFQLGGHSLNAGQVIEHIHKKLKVRIKLADIFMMPTIKGLSRYIRKVEKKKYSPLKASEKKEFYELSSAQKRLYILQQMAMKSMVYNISQVVGLNAVIDKNKSEQIFKQIIQRHESPRTSFEIIKGEPRQKIHNHVDLKIEYFRVAQPEDPQLPRGSPLPGGNIAETFWRPFDLSRAPLLRIGLIETKEQTPTLIIDIHHIICDGVSMKILLEEFQALYAGVGLTNFRLQYKDFAQWQCSETRKGKLKKQEEYWLNEFSHGIPIPDLPVDYPRPPIKSFAGCTGDVQIGRKETAALKRYARQQGITIYMQLLAIFYIFLAKITGQEDLIIGTPTAGRRHADLEKIMGMFVNTLALRNYPDGEKTVREFMYEIKIRTLRALENQDYPLEDLVESLLPERDPGRNPLFDVMFAFQHFFPDEGTEPHKELPDQNAVYHYRHQVSRFDLSFNGVEKDGALLFTIEYSSKLFKAGTISRFIGYFKKIISTVVKSPDCQLREIEIISPEEKKRLLRELNDTNIDASVGSPGPVGEKTIHALFEKQTLTTPDKIVLVWRGYNTDPVKKNKMLTFLELNERAGRLAQILESRGVTQDNIIGLWGGHSLELIISMLAVLKTGSAYLPLDSKLPGKRISYMLKDGNARILLTCGDIKNKPDRLEFTGEMIDPRMMTGNNKVDNRFKPANTAGLNDLAYVMYTSGSTGKPKGVMIEHKNVISLINKIDYFEFAPGDRLLITGSIAFDITTFEIWGPLINGAGLYLTDENTIPDAEKLRIFLVENRISILHLVPQLFDRLAAQQIKIFFPLKHLLIGGDIVHPRHPNRLLNKNKEIKIRHMYGPTENTTFSTFFLMERPYETRIPIGRPVSNSLIYVCDKYNVLQPTGIAGEIFVGGEGVSRGYLNNVELTGDKFKKNPFQHGKRNRMYKTGDLGRWLPEGNLEFSGRLDFQVKIRGHRIELEEIRRELLNHGKIKEAVVAAKEDQRQEKYLCAYVVSNGQLDINELRNALSGNLPAFMVPSYFVQLERIPLTQTGKINRDQLPEPGVNPGKTYTPPGNALEKKLVEIWAEILGQHISKPGQKNHQSIGIDDNFFEIGGHSLKATLMTAKVHQELNIKLPLAEVFKSPTVRSLSLSIQKLVKERYIYIKSTEKRDRYALSPAQQRLYILQQMNPGSTILNMPQFLQVEGEIDGDKLEYTFKQLILRHESLRTAFLPVKGKPVQKIYDYDQVKFKIEHYEISEEETEALAPRFINAFDLENCPLLKVGLIRTGKKNGASTQYSYILTIDIHHIISDGASHQILVQDFMSIYSGRELPSLRLQYKDHSQWQKNEKNKDVLNGQEKYWLEVFKKDRTGLNLPIDYQRPALPDFAVRNANFEIGSEETRALKNIALETNSSLFIVLLTIYNIFLYKLTGQEDIVVTTAISGRNHAGLENIIGAFVNVLPLRNFPGGEKIALDFLQEVRDRTLEAFENQNYQFENFIDKINNKKGPAGKRLYEVGFTLQNIEVPPIEIPGVKIRKHNKSFELENRALKVDINLEGYERGNQLFFTFIYLERLFKTGTIKRFIGYLQSVIFDMIRNPGKKIKEITTIPENEKKDIHTKIEQTRVDFSAEFNF